MTGGPDPRPVVAGVDGSEAAARAARFAADEAARRGTRLRLLHALQWPFEGRPLIGPGAVDPDDPEEPVDLHTAVQRWLDGVAASVGDLLPADRIERTVDRGDAVAALRAASAGAQLVVVGARGVGGVTGLLIGSTAAGLAATARCPLVVLPEETFVSASERRSVVVGIEGRGEDEVLAFAFAEASLRRTDLVAVHAWQDVLLDPAYRSASPLVDRAGVQADEQRVLAEALAGWRDKEPDVAVREVVIRDRTARALMAAGLLAELLVVGRRHRGPLGSVAHGVVHRSGCPVAVVPVGQEPDR